MYVPFTNQSTAVTGTWALPFTAYLLYLSGSVVYQRNKAETFIGDQSKSVKDKPAAKGTDPLLVSTRCYANFVENVPVAFLLAGIAEINGADRTALNYLMGALLALRVAHVEFGLKGKDTMAAGRPIGYLGTNAIIVGLAGYSAYLSKGYWGY